MKKYPLEATHLNYDRKRQKQFKKSRKKIESCVGLRTNALIDLPANDLLGDINFINPAVYNGLGNNTFSHLLLPLSVQQPLKYGYNTIGRSSRNDIVVDDPFVSRTHCSLLVHSDGKVELFDTASANGTFVNEIKVTRIYLKPWDLIQIGETKVTFIL